MNPDRITRAEAAAMLGTSEATFVRRYIRTQVLREHTPPGRRIPRLYDRADVQRIALSQGRMRFAPEDLRTVAVLGDHEGSLLFTALQSHGLLPTSCATLLEAIGATSAKLRPYVIICRKLDEQEERLIELYGNKISATWHDDEWSLRETCREASEIVSQRNPSS